MRSPTHRCVVVVLSLMAASSGCTTHHFDITLTPRGDGVDRTVSVWRTTSQNSERSSVGNDELTLLAQVYRHDIPAAVDRTHTFRAEFAKQMPQDVGGHGFFERYKSPCGTVTAYVERFRGSHDLIGEIEARRQAADQIIDLLVRWSETEFGQDPLFPKAKLILTTTVRQDLENLSCFVYFGIGSEASENVMDAMVARVSLFLVERNYATPSDLPMLARAMDDLDKRGDPQRLGVLLHQVVLRQLDVRSGEEASNAFALLRDVERTQASLLEFLRTTPEFRELRELSAKLEPDSNVDPSDVITTPLARALLPATFLQATDQVTLQLLSGREPYKSNGEWDAMNRGVNWDFRVELREIKRGSAIPSLCYALWAQPDVEFQMSHFGKVVLDDDSLLQYCLWYRGLTDSEIAEWNTFVNGLTPDNAPERLRKFRFRGELVISEPEKRVAERALRLLLPDGED
jgi:hypothetical protein